MQKAAELDSMAVRVALLVLTVRKGRLNVMLWRQPNPFKGIWGLAETPLYQELSADETAQEFTARVLWSEQVFMEQLFTFTEPHRDPCRRTVAVAYLVIWPWELPGNFGAGSLRCFEPVLLDGGRLRLRDQRGETVEEADLILDHADIIATGVQRLRNKIEYTDIGFYFLQDRSAFSLSELQEVFEAVLGTALDGSNFRRFIRTRYEQTGRIRRLERLKGTGGRGRPPALYRFE